MVAQRAATPRTTKVQLEEALQREQWNVQLLEERFADLELAIEDRGWMRMSDNADREFSREGLKKIMLLAVMSFLKNPLIRHATQVQAHYVWGQGVNIHCPDPQMNTVIQTFLKDRRNKKVLTGNAARIEREEELQTKANLFLVLFTAKSDGRVQVRSIPAEEVTDIIRNPDDSAEIWYYKRQYNRMIFNTETGVLDTHRGTIEYYPDWLYEPDTKPAKIGDAAVKWDTPVYHVATNRLGDMKFGIPEHYASLDWAAAVKNDLEDYATIRRALARFAWKLTVAQGPKAVSTAKRKMGSTIGTSQPAETNPPATAGSTWIQPAAGANLDPIRTAGMAPNPEEGRRLWLMVSAGTGIPETILTGDSKVGNYATSRTLDRPTELKMKTRQELWSDVYRDILTYVVRKSKVSITGELSSLPQVVEAAIREAVAIVNLGDTPGGDADTDLETSDLQINIDFPQILEHDVLPRVQAIVQAATLNGQMTAGTMSDRTMIRLLLRALNVDQVDALLDEILPEGAEYFDTDNDPVAEPDPFLAAGDEEDGPPNPFKEAANNPDRSALRRVPKKPKPKKPGEEEDPENENVDESGVGLSEDGLHKVAPPPPSMRNQKGKSPNPFDSTTPQPQMDPTGTFESDKDSQRMKGATPKRGDS